MKHFPSLVSLSMLLTTVVPEVAAQRAARPATSRQPAEQPVRIRTGIASDLGQPVPLKLYDFEVLLESDTTKRLAVQTDLDGAVDLRLRPGKYVLRSIKPAIVAGRSYRWELPVEVSAGRPATVQVTSNNAISRGARPTRAFANAVELYNALQSGIVRINAGLGHGTGFLVDGYPGLVVTNDHVVPGESEVIVQLDSVTSVFANKLVRDQDADLAILRVNPSACPECLGLRLARAQSSEQLVSPGETLVAIGYPLSQKLSITSGIASSVRDGAIISDVSVNPGNSGGPMLNMYGDVVGVNTFAEAGRIGAGISGAVTVAQLIDLLSKSEERIAAAATPSAELLPVMPRARYPVSLLRGIADTASSSEYDVYSLVDAQNFKISVSTPVAFLVRSRASELDVAGNRRRRELRAGVSEDESYSELAELRDWREYVGDETAPLVGFKIEPKDGLEGEGMDKLKNAASRVFRRGQSARREFKGDVRGVTFTRNGRMVRYVQGGHAPQRIEETGLTDLKDVADFGYYALLPDVFEPDSTGIPPVVELEIADLRNPNLPRRVVLPPAVVARIWNDFVPYLESQYPERKIVPSKLPLPASKGEKPAVGADSTSGNRPGV